MSRNRSASLYVRNIAEGTRHEDLRRMFGKYGRIYDVTLPLDYYTGRMKGFAFVEYEESEDAEEAQYRLDKTRYLGRELEIEFTRGSRKTPSDMRNKERSRRFDDRRSSGGGRRRSRSKNRGGRSRSRSRSASPRERGSRRSPSPSRRQASRSFSRSPIPASKHPRAISGSPEQQTSREFNGNGGSRGRPKSRS